MRRVESRAGDALSSVEQGQPDSGGGGLTSEREFWDLVQYSDGPMGSMVHTIQT